VSRTGGYRGRRSSAVRAQLCGWNSHTQMGVVYESCTGFRMPDGLLLSPDASWVARQRWEALSRQQREGFIALCPNAVLEIRSSSQPLEELQEKMETYIRNGVRVGVLIGPYGRAVEVYRPGRQPQRYEDPDRVVLDPELPGFVLGFGPVLAPCRVAQRQGPGQMWRVRLPHPDWAAC
jgi:Uma2 family endonuclease